MTIKSDFMDITNKRPARETCFYQHVLEIEYTPEETQISVEIENLPPGLTFNPDTLSIIGTVEEFNTWHPCKDYIINSLNNIPDDVVLYPDCYENIDDVNNLVPLTAGYLKTLRETHYAGKNYGKYGSLAYVADGNALTQEIKIIVEYLYTPKTGAGTGGIGGTGSGSGTGGTGDKLQPVIKIEEILMDFPMEVARSPRKFVTDYGDSNELIGENNEPCNGVEFLEYLDRLGKVVSGGC